MRTEESKKRNGIDLICEQELQSLVGSLLEQYGADFRDYAGASFRRRIISVLRRDRLPDVRALERQLLGDKLAFERFIHGISVNVTAMFRDPPYYLFFRARVVPLLASYPFIRIWVPGCSTGEEVYSLAIMLQEEGLHDRTRIYATDIDAIAVEQARTGAIPLGSMKEYSENYFKAGGTRSLSEYYTVNGSDAFLSEELRHNMVLAQHNLVTDGSFNEFHVVVCRNVLIYFNVELRDRVLSLLSDSLVSLGVLTLGAKESLRFTSVEPCYEQLSDSEKVYRKIV